MNLRPLITWISTIFRRFRRVFRRKPKSIHYHVADTMPAFTTPAWMSPTKAYADQRQRAKRNRRRKPSKRMRHIYKALR